MHFAPLRYAIVVQWLAFGKMEENKEIPLAPEIDDRKEGKTTFFLFHFVLSKTMASFAWLDEAIIRWKLYIELQIIHPIRMQKKAAYRLNSNL